MEISIKINTDNAAFCADEDHDYTNEDEKEELNELNDEARDQEVNRILKTVVKSIENGNREGRCIDANGNHVGDWAIHYAARERA